MCAFLVVQNYFKDSWNVFDFITVVGSIIDVLVTEVNVSPCRLAFSDREWLDRLLTHACRYFASVWYG